MLSKKSLAALAALTKLDVSVIEAAIADTAEKDIAVPENVSFLTADELTQRDANMKATGKREGETMGEEKGKELATKAIKNKLGITDASKDPEAIALLIQGKMTGDTALKEQVTLLQKEITEKDGQIVTLKAVTDGAKNDAELLGLLPAKKSSALETSEHLDLVKRNLEFTTDGIKFKGEILREPGTQNVLSKKAAVEHFYNQRPGLLEESAAGGRGGTDSKGGSGKSKTLKEVRKAWEATNPGQNWGNEASQDHVKAVLKDNAELVMDDDGL